MNLQGWIIYNGNLQGDQFLDFAQWFHYAAKEQNITTTIYANNELLTFFTGESTDLIHPNTSLPDFVIFTDKDIYLAKQLELLGIRVFNSADAINISDDKIATYQMLAQKKLPIPKTIVAPKIFANHPGVHIDFLTRVTETLRFPMIIKEAFGSFGEQVYLVHNESEMRERVNQLTGKAYVFQEFIQTSYGKDIRLQVVGNRVVASMLRTSKDDFRANIIAGGKMESYKPTKEEQQLAIYATQAIGADFAGVDLLFGQDDQPILCEVNSNAHIRNLYKCTNINVADFIIDYIVKNINM